MSPKIISEEILETVRNHHDIVDVIGQRVTLKKSGRNFLGICPFHSEKTPSFSVSQEKQIFHCFGCGAGGDVIKFIMDYESLDFRETVQHLADEAGLNVPVINQQVSQDPNDQLKQQIYQANELASKLYHYMLLETNHGKEAFNYLQKRGFSRELIEIFNIGYSPPAWDTVKSFLLKRGFSLELIEQSGLIIKSEDGNTFDRFRNRIIFPITDAGGRIIAFGGRVLDDNLPKYLNSPESIVFNKSKTLYNLFLAKKEIRKKRQAILFEGYIDIISVYKAGVHNGVATLGTSLTEEQVKLLKRYTEEVIICFDSDLAGQKATFKAIDILHQTGLRTKVLQLPQGQDPDDYITKHGVESFNKDILTASITATTFKLQFMRRDYSLNDQTERIKYITKALDVIADLEHAIEREHYLKDLSEEFQLSLQSLKNDMNQIYHLKRKKKEKTRDNLTFKWNNSINNGNHVGRVKPLYPAYYNAERQLVCLMIRDKDIATRVQEEIGSEFHVEDFAVLAAYLYSYYGRESISDINRFISSIEDQKYSQLATKLAMLEINEDASELELDDYIKQVKRYNLDLEIKKKREEQLKAERNQDLAKSLEIGQRIIELRNQLRWGIK